MYKRQTSDLLINHQGINQWLVETNSSNIKVPIVVDLSDTWQLSESNTPIDGIYTANTLHIVSWELVIKFFEGISKHLTKDGCICIYGPFNYEGEYTSESNAQFDLWLKDRDQNSGIRDIEAVLSLANAAKLSLIEDHEMPANNRLLVFKAKL